jgi:hypothetical protein
VTSQLQILNAKLYMRNFTIKRLNSFKPLFFVVLFLLLLLVKHIFFFRNLFKKQLISDLILGRNLMFLLDLNRMVGCIVRLKNSITQAFYQPLEWNVNTNVVFVHNLNRLI